MDDLLLLLGSIVSLDMVTENAESASFLLGRWVLLLFLGPLADWVVLLAVLAGWVTLLAALLVALVVVLLALLVVVRVRRAPLLGVRVLVNVDMVVDVVVVHLGLLLR